MIIHAISDLHLGQGHEDSAARAAYKAFAQDQPADHVVWVGDVAELASCSSHGATEMELGPELEAVRDQISDLIDHGAHNHFVAGNHEDRYNRALSKFVPALKGGLPLIQELLGLGELGFDSFTPFKECLELAGVLFTHGTYAGANHAGTMLHKYPRNVVYGHTHKPMTQWAPQFATDAGRFAMGIGCLRTLQPGWAPGPTGWTSGFGVIYVDGPVITPYSIVMQEGRFIGPDGRTYG
jgi:predicted phosphodiesterase